MMTMNRFVLCILSIMFTCCVCAEREVYRINGVADVYSCGLRRVVDTSTRRVGFENKKSQLVLPADYCAADRFVKRKCAVMQNAVLEAASATDGVEDSVWVGGQWGVIAKDGHIIKPCRYERRWSEAEECYLYVSPQDSFIFTSKGKIKER